MVIRLQLETLCLTQNEKDVIQIYYTMQRALKKEKEKEEKR